MPSTPIYDATLALLPASLRAAPLALYSWQPGATPLSTATGAAATIAAWLALIFGGREAMRSRDAFSKSLKWPFFVHVRRARARGAAAGDVG